MGRIAQEWYRIDAQDDAAPSLTVEAGVMGSAPIRSRIFGNFLEHLGYAIQGGVQAELLLNKTFFAMHRFPRQNLPEADRIQLRENGVNAERLHLLTEAQQQNFAGWRPHLRTTGFGLLILDDQSDYGIPIPWTLTPHGAGAGGQNGRVGSSMVLAPAGARAVLAQGIFPPHERTLVYHGYLWAKVYGEATLSVALRRRSPLGNGEILAEVALATPGEMWEKFDFTLTLPEGVLRPLEPVDFCIVVEGAGRVWVDKASLLPSDHVEGLDPILLDQIRSLAPPTLRWPGGNFTSTYHWWEGIGPQDERQTYPNTDWWGLEDNSFGIAEFLRLCELVETEPHLCVNMGNGTAEEAANWVEYVNGSTDTHWGNLRAAHGHLEPWDVKLWEIGNEIYGPWQTGNCGSEENARRHRVWAEAMLAVDPTLELLATGFHADFTEPWHHWNETLLRDGGPHVGSIALHALPGNATGLTSHPDLVALWHDLMSHPHRWERLDLPGLLALSDTLAPGRDVDISITEWGILGDTQRPQVGNLGGAIYAALFLNMSVRLHEVIRVANATALMHGGALRKAGPFHYEDPQIEVIRRYTTLAGGERLPLSYRGATYAVQPGVQDVPAMNDVPWVDGVVVRTRTGEVVVALVNRSAHETFTVPIAISEGMRFTPASWEVMTGHMRGMNTPVAPDRVRFVEQPLPEGGSTVTVTLPARGIGWLKGRLS